MQAAAPMMAIGSLVQGIGSLQSGLYNNKVAKENARQEVIAGNDAAGDVYRDARMAEGRQIGTQAESGFQVGTGSAADSLRESTINAEFDALRARRQAAAKAAALRAQGRQAKREGIFGAVSSAIGAAGAIAGHKANYANQAAPYGSTNAIKVTVPSGPVFTRRT